MAKVNSCERHKELHSSLDELLACYVGSNLGKSISLWEFIEWSHKVTLDPSLCPEHNK